jgi:hypothetical protein
MVNPNAPTGIVEVNSITGAQSILSSGGLFSGPIDIRERPNGTLYVDDYKAQTTGAVIAVDPATGDQSLVASDGYINAPSSLQYMKSRIFVANNPATGSPNFVQINLSTGKHMIISHWVNSCSRSPSSPGPAIPFMLPTMPPMVPAQSCGCTSIQALRL